ncbi:AMN1 [Candida theae]|uniref:AMN1 n=1 Tax=Candida theae TaxID=1198502 RepID=A0AAD5BDL7_9ASCO|nr:AMN1 [Candida theae]KAI5957572.1 AMN1 [Candida theae]
MSYNPTEPLPYDSSDNCPIYNPFSGASCVNETDEEHGGEEYTPLKKSRRVISSNSLSAFLQRTKRDRVGSRSRSRSRMSSRWFRGDECCKVGGDSCNSSNASSPSSSDLESLPDLTDDDADTPDTTPVKPSHKFTFLETVTPGRKLDFTGCDDVTCQSQEVVAHSPSLEIPNRTSRTSLFDVPELVHRILLFVEAQNDRQPCETTPIRRKPTSYNHALLIYGDRESAQRAMADDCVQLQNDPVSNPLFNCLLVNKLFNRIAREIIAKKFYFSNDAQFQKYASSSSSSNINTTIPSCFPIKFNPQSFSLYKLFRSNQYLFNMAVSNINFHNLTSFELFMCPKIYPSWNIFQSCGSTLQTLVLTGSKSIDDEFCFMISRYCQNLTHLDLRACELITDSGLYHIFKNNRSLQSVNVGRKHKGHLITDSSITTLIKNNCQLHTLGLAGTCISDVVLWQTGHHLKQLSRLSLNNCPRLTNSGVANVLNQPGVFSHLTVLELRFNLQLTDLTSLIRFKSRKQYQYQHCHSQKSTVYGELLLVELCETLMYRMRRQELDLDKLISNRIMHDILYWINDQWDSDGDLPFIELLNSRKRKRQ